MLTLGEAGWLSDDGGGFGGRCSLNDQESVGEGGAAGFMGDW